MPPIDPDSLVTLLQAQGLQGTTDVRISTIVAEAILAHVHGAFHRKPIYAVEDLTVVRDGLIVRWISTPTLAPGTIQYRHGNTEVTLSVV